MGRHGKEGAMAANNGETKCSKEQERGQERERMLRGLSIPSAKDHITVEILHDLLYIFMHCYFMQ